MPAPRARVVPAPDSLPGAMRCTHVDEIVVVGVLQILVVEVGEALEAWEIGGHGDVGEAGADGVAVDEALLLGRGDVEVDGDGLVRARHLPRWKHNARC